MTSFELIVNTMTLVISPEISVSTNENECYDNSLGITDVFIVLALTLHVNNF